MCRLAVCWEAVPPPQPNSIYMHSWPGRCKNRQAVPELEMVTDCCLQLLGFRVLCGTGRRAEGVGVQSTGAPTAVPLGGVAGRTAMGNAPICHACHSDKGMRTPGNIQDLDRIPDYYGCNCEESKEPEARVSLGWSKQELKGKIKVRVVHAGFEKGFVCSAWILLNILQYSVCKTYLCSSFVLLR